jgi:hypothetical protein
MKFYCEAKSSIPLPPQYTFPQAFNYLNKTNNSFYILENENNAFIQCAGEKHKCCVEYHNLIENKRYRLAKGEINSDPDKIEMSNGIVTIRSDEKLNFNDAILIFDYFYKNNLILNTYRLNSMNHNFRS